MKLLEWILGYAIPILLVGLGVPLILEVIPPNTVYGFRTPQTLASPELWYRVNQWLGIALVLSGVIGLLANVSVYPWVRHHRVELLPVAMIVTTSVPVLVAALVIWALTHR